MKVHKLIGGQRFVDTMGSDPQDIQFGGLFLGQDAAPAARAIQALIDAAQAVTLTWGSYSFSVLPTRIEFDYQLDYQIGYQITLVVLTVATAAPSTTTLQSVNADLSSANAVLLPSAAAGTAVALSGVRIALQGVTSLPSSSAQTLGVLGALQGAQGVAAAAAAQAAATLSGLPVLGSESTTQQLASHMAQAVAAAQVQAQLTTVANYTARAAGTLQAGGLV